MFVCKLSWIAAKSYSRPGHAVVMAYLILFLLGGSALQFVLLRVENSKRRAGKRNVWVDGKSETEVEALGDKRFVFHILYSQQRLFIY